MRSWIVNLVCLAGVWLNAFGASPGMATNAPAELPGIHNFFRLTDNVFSGSQPDGDAGFATLVRLGVKTIISVDGAKPDVASAARHGLRYVHLPFGYDGIPTNRVADLVKAAMVLPGPIYVHCHHGQHRGPAAAGVICLATQGWTKHQAEAFLHAAGTSPEYPGLYRAVREFVAPTPAELARVSTNFPSVAKTSSFVEAMVTIDGYAAGLKAAQKVHWQTPKDHPDVSPDHESVLLWEAFRELARTVGVAKRPADFHGKLAAAEHAADRLHVLLRTAPPDTRAADAAFHQVNRACANCHRRYRNQ